MKDYYICYFIGGPLDLTKTVKERAEQTMYALAPAALALTEINTVQDYKNARTLIDERHVYHAGPPAKMHGADGTVIPYIYAGMKRSNNL